jgi:hypothetical protein
MINTMTSGSTFAKLAQAQDLCDVLDLTYTPLTSIQIDLFWEKQNFLYAMLEAKIEAAKGKSIIRK